MMTYKGYTGVLEIDEGSNSLCGDVIGLRDLISFQGATVEEARQAFHDSVDCYLEFCASRGEPPEKPFSGRFLVRVDPALHRGLVEAATARGVSLNALVTSTLSEAFPVPAPTRKPRSARPKPKAKKAARPSPSAPKAKTRPAAPAPG